MPAESRRERALRKIKELRVSLKVVHIMESKGTRTASERLIEEKIAAEAELLMKEAFALGLTKTPCPDTGRV